MDISQLLDSSFKLVDWIVKNLYDLPLPSSDRAVIAAGCFAVTQEHHHSIAVLIKENLNGSALALVRPTYESYIRGLWISHCASDDEVANFIAGMEPPKIKQLLEKIEAIPAFEEKILSKVKAESWDAMCGYTHTGSLQVQRWISSEAIESNYSIEEIKEALNMTGAISLLSALGVASIADNESLAKQILEKTKEFTDANKATNHI